MNLGTPWALTAFCCTATPRQVLHSIPQYAAGRYHTRGRSLDKAAADPSTIPDSKHARYLCLHVIAQFQLAGVELDFHPVEEGVARSHPRTQLVHGLEHLHDVFEVPVRQHEAEVPGRGALQRGLNDAALHPLLRGPATAQEIAQPLHDHSPTEDVGQAGHVL